MSDEPKTQTDTVVEETAPVVTAEASSETVAEKPAAQEATPETAPAAQEATPAAQPAAAATAAEEPRRRATKRNFRSRAPRRKERVKPEYEQKIIALRRVTRVMAGGRRFSFSVSLVIGDKNGRVGLGQGKATDTALAIEKAFNDAKRNLVKIQMTDEKSIAHEVRAKYNAAVITLRPNHGRGLVAGSSVRTILEFAGITNTTSRVLSRSRNKMNNARAAMKALEPFVTARGAAAAPAKKAPAENTAHKDDRSAAPKTAEKKA